jgi:hypothetical protein
LAVVALLLAGVELASRYAFPRIDRGMRRVAVEETSAVEMRKQPISARQLLVVGNSLLEDDVQFDDVRRSLRPDVEAVRLAVPDTNYNDWYYGLRSLFARGARPDAVVLMLCPRQLVSSRIRCGFSPHHLFQTDDVLRVARRLELSNTDASNLLFARFSAYFADGDEIRKDVLGKMLPDLPALMSLMTRTASPPLAPDEVYETAADRLKELRELAEARDTRIVLVVPPSGESKGDASYEAVRRAGTAADLPVILPAEAGSLGPDLYSDGFHLNRRGATVFTPQFIAALKKDIAGCWTTR